MRYLSVCSGIEAATVAWAPLGWDAIGYAEIERFPSEVLAHHYGSNLPGERLSSNGTPNFGNVENFRAWPDADFDVLVGGTPCQSFSVAGLRGGLADPRGNLALVYLAIAERYRPAWCIWENVPGVLSSGDGRDFGAFLGGLGELGYGFAYRVLDAQYVRVNGLGRAVPQRRRRVFVVGHLGDWRRAAAVLFDAASLRGDPAPRRSSGKGVARPIASCAPGGSGYRNDADTAENLVAFALNAHGGPAGRIDAESKTFVVAPPLTHNPYGDHESREGLLVAHALRAEGFDASEDGTGRGTPLVAVAGTLTGNGDAHRDAHSGFKDEMGLVPIAFDTTQITSPTNRCQPQAGDPCHPLASRAHAPALAFQVSESGVRVGDTHATLDANNGPRRHNGVIQDWAVRRLTPLECERLQGFPDGYTAIPRGGKIAADGPRYKALGNSMAVNCIRWIGQRIELAASSSP